MGVGGGARYKPSYFYLVLTCKLNHGVKYDGIL